MQKTTKTDILIVGASYVGMAMALAASRVLSANTQITLVDAKPVLAPGSARPEHDPRATAVTAASRNLLERIGVWERLHQHACTMAHIDLTDTQPEDAVRPVILNYDNQLPSNGNDDEPASHVVENHHLKNALLETLHDDPGITVRAPLTISDLSRPRSSGAHTPASGPAITTETGDRIEAELIIAADGRGSFLRRAAGIKCVTSSPGQSGIVTTIRHEKPHDNTATQHFLPAGPLAVLPLNDNRSSIVWVEETDDAKRIMASDKQTFRDTLASRIGTHLGRIDLDGPRAAWPLGTLLARALVADGLVLIGDAAHGVLPIAGQGFNIALTDVAVLLDRLAEAQALGLALADGQALRAYEQQRRAAVTRDAFAMEAINRLFSSDSLALRTVRGFGFGMIDRIPALKQRIVAQASGDRSLPPLLRRLTETEQSDRKTG